MSNQQKKYKKEDKFKVTFDLLSWDNMKDKNVSSSQASDKLSEAICAFFGNG